MPTVQRVTGPSVRGVGSSGVSSGRVSGQAANVAGALGKGVADVANVVDAQLQWADDLRVEEATNQLREKQLDLTMGQKDGYSNLKGRNVLPVDGESMVDRFDKTFKATAMEIQGTLSNERQKQKFQQYADRANLEFRGGAMRHENAQIADWRQNTVKGVIATESNTAAANWQDPAAINLARDRIVLNLANMRQYEGIPADQMEAIQLESMTKFHSGVMEQMVAAKDFNRTEQYLKDFGSEIEAGTVLKVRTLVEKEKTTTYAISKAATVIGEYADKFEPNDMTRLVNLTAGAESGGRQFDKDGKPLESKKGAIGVMQVMPTTAPEAAKLAKLPWDEERYKNDKEYNKAIGTAYLQEQLRVNGGNVPKALAAYNAGPGALKDAVVKAEKDGKPGEWLSYLPKETREYVPKILNQYTSGQGVAKKPTFAEMDEKLRADPELMRKPEGYKIAREQLKMQYDDQEKAVKQRQDEAEGEVYRRLYETGGDFNGLPSELRASMDPTKLDSAMNFAKRLRAGEDAVTNPALYQRLTENPAMLKNMTEGQFYALRKDLSLPDFKHFSNERAKVMGKGIDKIEDLNTQAMNSTLNQRLTTLQIDPTPKGQIEGARVGAIRQFVTRSLLDAQRAAGKQLSDAEVVKHIDGLFAQNVTFQNSFAGFRTGKSTMAILNMKASDIPSDERNKIKAAFKANNMPEPSDADLIQVYWNQRFNQNKQSVLSQAKPPVSVVDQIPR